MQDAFLLLPLNCWHLVALLLCLLLPFFIVLPPPEVLENVFKYKNSPIS